MPNDIFDDPNTQEFTPDPTKQYLVDLVGDGKKFKDAEALARGKMESDNFITRLQKENAELRDDLKTRVTMQAVLDKLGKPVVTPDPNDDGNNSHASERKDVLKPEDIEAMMAKTMERQRAVDSATANRKSANDALLALYGSTEAAQAEVSRKSRELGLNTETVKKMAEEAPAAFVELFKKQERPAFVSPPIGMRNTPDAKFMPGSPQPMSKWADIRKADPVFYHSEKAAIKRHNDALALGEAYFDKE